MLYLIISSHGKYKKAVGNHPTQEDQERKWMYAYLPGCLSRVSLRARLNRVLIFTLRVCWRWLYWWDHILLLLKDGAMEAFKSLDAYDVAVYGFLYVLSDNIKSWEVQDSSRKSPNPRWSGKAVTMEMGDLHHGMTFSESTARPFEGHIKALLDLQNRTPSLTD